MRTVIKIALAVLSITLSVVVLAGGRLFGLSPLELLAVAAGSAGAATLL